LQEKGVQKGDRIVGILNNTVETIAIFLAVNSLGAIWSCCSPDFGDKSIIERFAQIEPKVLFLETEYQYNGKSFSKQETLVQIQKYIPSIETVLAVYEENWKNIFSIYTPVKLSFLRVPFSH